MGDALAEDIQMIEEISTHNIFAPRGKVSMTGGSKGSLQGERAAAAGASERAERLRLPVNHHDADADQGAAHAHAVAVAQFAAGELFRLPRLKAGPALANLFVVDIGPVQAAQIAHAYMRRIDLENAVMPGHIGMERVAR